MSEKGIWIAASFGGLVVRGLEVAAKLALYMFAARWLDDRQCGALFLGMSWGMLVATAARRGLEKALARMIAAELAVSQGSAALSALLQGHLKVLVAGTGLGLLTVLVAPFASTHLLRAATTASLQATGVLIPCLAICVTASFALVGFGRTILSQFLQNLSWPLGMLAALGLGVRDAGSLLLVMAGTQLLATGVAFVAFSQERGRLRTDLPLSSVAVALPSLREIAAPLYVVELVQVSINSLPVLLLGGFAEARGVALFSVANRASMLVLVITLSLGLTAAPQFASLHRRGKTLDMAATARRTQWAGLALGGPVCAGLALFGGPVLSVINPDYADGRWVLAVMAGGQFVSALYTGQDSLLAMTGHGTTLRILNLGQLAAMILLGFALIPPFGAMGAAIVAATVTALGAASSAVAVATFLPEVAPCWLPPFTRSLRHLMSRWV